MQTLAPQALLEVWERGLGASPVTRGLLLFGAALPQVDGDALMDASIGHRDAWLLNLREALFGVGIECLLACPACAQRIELDFRVDDIRAPHASARQLCEIPIDGTGLRFRVPSSADLLAIQDEHDAQAAEWRLLERCWAGTVDAPQASLPAPLAPDLMQAVADAMGEADRQAEVLLEVACPACGHRSLQLFDIVEHLWCELDHWARGLLQKVHVLACRYGWCEDCILGMSATRRQTYLDLIEAA